MADPFISDDQLIGLDEFALLPENAAQAGVSGPLPAVQRIDRGTVSAVRWGTDPARVVFLHGGGQNAHTWDTVILGLGTPALAVDLPGHGRSAWREDGDYGPKLNADTIEPMVQGAGGRGRPGGRHVAGWPDGAAAGDDRTRTWSASWCWSTSRRPHPNGTNR